MTWSFVGTSYAATLVGIEPNGTSQNDVLLAWVNSGDAGQPTITGPAGWTQVDFVKSVGATLVQGAWLIVRGAAAPSLVWTGAVSGSIEIDAYRGLTATPLDVHGISDNAAGVGPSSPSVLTTQANDLVVVFYGSASDPGVITVPAGTTRRFANPSADFQAGADFNQAVAGATGAQAWSTVNSVPSITATVALKQAAALGLASPLSILGVG